MQAMRKPTTCRTTLPNRSGKFLSQLTPAAVQDIESTQHVSDYPANRIIFSERETPDALFIVVSGDVKLSINSSDGRRLSLRIVHTGEVLGLASVLSGTPYEVTAETLYPARIAKIERADFLDFLTRHPEAYKAVTDELSRNVNLACERLRVVGLSTSAPEKLAKLLLDWGEVEQPSENTIRFRFCLTHEQIGEFIGASRETVTRTMGAFKDRHLVAFQGSMLTIPSRTALATYARG
jgi:CRP/FNR family cyclic AMP-dependent transcriptional regulator